MGMRKWHQIDKLLIVAGLIGATLILLLGGHVGKNESLVNIIVVGVFICFTLPGMDSATKMGW